MRRMIEGGKINGKEGERRELERGGDREREGRVIENVQNSSLA